MCKFKLIMPKKLIGLNKLWAATKNSSIKNSKIHMKAAAPRRREREAFRPPVCVYLVFCKLKLSGLCSIMRVEKVV